MFRLTLPGHPPLEVWQGEEVEARVEVVEVMERELAEVKGGGEHGVAER